MFDEKKWYTSKTIWGGAITIAASAAGFLGVSVSADDVDKLSDLAVLGAAFVGGIVTIYGRIKARRVIK